MKRLLKTGVAALAVGLAFLIAPALAAADNTAHEGGSIIVSFNNDVATLDPAIGYDWQNWSMIKALFDGLMTYEPGTTKLVPDLAESYKISNDGKTYTFKLRQGVKFHNGRTMTADDVKYSLDRVVDPKTKSPGAGFFSNIVGYDAVSGGKADSLSGVKVLDPGTVEIDLNQPDAAFLQKMALNFSFIVPKEAVEKYGADFGKHPVGTGPFKMDEWVLGQRLVFVKNKDYWRQGVPKLDKITFEFGQEPIVALLRLQHGEVDIAGDGIPPAKFLQVMKDPNMKKNVVVGSQLQTGYITMNTSQKPFDNLKVRKAVNMAINKRRVIQIINGRAIPAQGVLPPLMPGYDKDYKGYKYDPDAAKKLLAEAGYPNGFTTQLYVYNTDPQPRIAQAIQRDLAQIGIKAEIKSLAQANVIAAGGSKQGVPLIWSGGMAWIDDYPDPSDFYWPILSCTGAEEGGWNWAKYCNKTLDAEASKADALADPSKQEERNKMWSDIFAKVMADAPWVPVF
ncbi:MAG TPA: ABC transporter substrate-binding protein, partial [Pararhizobium sp.]|nr:ABC transporter substrate-binding protein [Pararhizobium sp.]